MQYTIKVDLVEELKNFLVSSGVPLLIYPRVVKKMCQVDFFLKHSLVDEDFEHAWGTYGLGQHVLYVTIYI